MYSHELIVLCYSTPNEYWLLEYQYNFTAHKISRWMKSSILSIKYNQYPKFNKLSN